MLSLVCKKLRNCERLVQKRFFLSKAYNLDDVWSKRFENQSILEKTQPENLYFELERQFSRSKSVSAIDVDIFANSIADQDVSFVDELLDALHKLRMCAQTGSTLPSTHYAVVRYLVMCEQFQSLFDVLNDRLNYGIFLDTYLGNYVMDVLWKNKDYMNGARIASLFMLQEDFDHATIRDFSLLHCVMYLKNKDTCKKWPIPEPPVEPKEVIKVRVKFLRNPYFDEHFDLVDPDRILGKTLLYASQSVEDDVLKVSFQLLGAILFQKFDKVKQLMSDVKNNVIFHEILNFVPVDFVDKQEIEQRFRNDERNLVALLESRVRNSLSGYEKDEINRQIELHKTWAALRVEELDKQYKKLLQMKKIQSIQEELDHMKLKEMKLWFFENEEQIEMEIEDKDSVAQSTTERNQVTKTKKQLLAEENETYVPPFVQSSHNIAAMLKK